MTIDALASNVQRLVDIEQLKTLKSRYCRAVDSEDWPTFRSLFTEDVRVEVAEVGGVIEGLDEFIQRVIDRHTDGRMRSVHQCHTPELDVVGDEATGVWAMFDYVDRVVGGERRATQGYGHYHERYRRTAKGWKIASMRITRLRVDPVDIDRLPDFNERARAGV